MTVKLVLSIQANEGYSIDQVRSHVTVGDLKRYLEDMPDDAEVVTHDLNNRYGADWGKVCDYYEEEDDGGDDE